MNTLDVSLLRKMLRYDPDTGKLFWLPRTKDFGMKNCIRWNGRYAGKEAFVTKDSKGYFKSSLMNVTFRAHRVAWALYYGEWPAAQLDHINMDRSDNRIDNLRLADNAQNNQNRPAQSNNKSGYKGVFWDSNKQRWAVALQSRGVLYRGGAHKTLEAAAAAYAALCEKHHGDFARLQQEERT